MNVTRFITQPKDFVYFAPCSLEEASRILLAHGADACILAGGTDVVPMMKHGELSPKYIVNIKRIPNLNDVSLDGDILRIGALATIETIRRSSLIRDNYRGLHMASEELGSETIRNIATIAGNICRASPASDMTPPLVALGAILRIFGSEGERVVPIETFFEGPGKTRLRKGEIVQEIEVPGQQPQKQAFLKLKRVSTDLAKINICAVFDYDGKACHNIRVAIGSVGPTVVRTGRTEAFLEGKALSDDVLDLGGKIIQGEISPITDVRSTEDYRHTMSKVLLKRVIKTALNSGEGS